jgi:hypothetical protein
MAKHTFTRHLFQVKYDFRDEPHWVLVDSSDYGKGDPEWLYVGKREVEVDVPDEFLDMRASQLAGLRAQEQKLRAEFAKNITEIQARIQSLLALEMSA